MGEGTTGRRGWGMQPSREWRLFKTLEIDQAYQRPARSKGRGKAAPPCAESPELKFVV